MLVCEVTENPVRTKVRLCRFTGRLRWQRRGLELLALMLRPGRFDDAILMDSGAGVFIKTPVLQTSSSMNPLFVSVVFVVF